MAKHIVSWEYGQGSQDYEAGCDNEARRGLLLLTASQLERFEALSSQAQASLVGIECDADGADEHFQYESLSLDLVPKLSAKELKDAEGGEEDNEGGEE